MNPAKLLLISAGLLIYSLGGVAQAQATGVPVSPPSLPGESASETPESVATRYMEAMQRQDWKSCAALMHPDALKQLKQMFRPIIATAPMQDMGALFFDVKSTAEFESLSGEQAFERLMVSIGKMNPSVGSAIKDSQFSIIGHVLEASETAHVVYRLKLKTQGVSVTKLTVMPLKKFKDEWKGLLTGDIEGLAAALTGMKSSPATAKPPVKKPAPKPPAKPKPK